MRRYSFALAALAVAMGIVIVSSSSASASARACGQVSATRDNYTSRFQVKVVRGAVSCKTARHVIKAYNSGKGTLHTPPGGRVNGYTTLPGGWSCASGAGGEEGCSRGPKINSYQHRDQISATPVLD